MLSRTSFVVVPAEICFQSRSSYYTVGKGTGGGNEIVLGMGGARSGNQL
jgi:hypothetical protein